MPTNTAYRFDSETKTFTASTHQVEELQPGQVLVEVSCCTICGSDLHTFSGRRTAPVDCILGHEIIGTIAGWASECPPQDFKGEALSLGQRVTWAMAVGCGSCFYCVHQLSQKCESLFKYGHESSNLESPTGGLSGYCVLVPGTPIFRIPDSLSDEVACPANCATATVSAAVRLVLETHEISDSAVVIMGAGMLGLTAAAQLCVEGAKHVIVCDVDADRLEQTRSFGATHVVNVSDPSELGAVLKAVADGRGADIVMDFAGMLPAVELAFQSVRTGGCVLLAGSVFATPPLLITPESMIRRMLTVRGLHNYLPLDLASGLRFLELNQHRFPFGELVSKTFLLDETKAAFEFARDSRPVRIAVRSRALSLGSPNR